MTTPTYIFDVECYRNYFLVVFLDVKTGHSMYWERFNDIINRPLDLPRCQLIGFNSKGYDHPMLSAAMQGASNGELKHISDKIILQRTQFWEHDHRLDTRHDYIDIFDVLPGMASLKIYGGRIGFPKLKDLPIEPDAFISYKDAVELRRYCLIDCQVTQALYRKVHDQLDLRVRLGQKYHLDLRSKSDAQIAEAVIVSEYESRTGTKVVKPSSTKMIGRTFRYNPPDFLKFETPVMQLLLQEISRTDFEVGSKGAITLPANLHNRVVELNGNKYKLGIGGLHSVDKPGSFYADENIGLMDIDVASYYPAIILNCGYAPAQMADHFLTIYQDLVTQRLNAKASGDKVTADSLKITVNGSFGKLGNRYSKLYSPQLLIHVTVTGQLALLMLIESLGSSVISANTDGITVMYDKTFDAYKLEQQVLHWENATGFNMEWTPYRSLHRRDVNNYLAIKPDKSIKTKGIFAPGGLMKNPTNEVIIKAVIDHLVNGTAIDRFIFNHPIVMDFTSLRTVKGGAMKDGIQYGKSVRWYWSTTSKSAIHYQLKSKHPGNTVPNTERSRMMMDLTDEMPSDMDYERYIKETEKLLEQIT